MNIIGELPLYAIAVVGSFLQFSLLHTFKFLEDYSKSYAQPHGGTVFYIQLATVLSLLSWCICIQCVGVGLLLYFVEPLTIVEIFVSAILLLYIYSSLAAFVSLLIFIKCKY